MSQSAQIILGAPNPFTVNPSMTYFKSNYEPQDSPLGESFEIPFDNQQVRFGTTSECTLPAYGDLLTKAFLRTTLPAIYPPQTGTYVFPQTSTSFSGALLVQKNLTYITADGSNLTANTVGSHFFSVGAEVILSGTAYSFFNLDGVYTISSIPTANSFVCSSGIAGISYNGKVSTTGIRPAPVVGYYSTQNLNLWAEIPVNLPYSALSGQITNDSIVNLVPSQTITVSSSLSCQPVSGATYIVATSSANTFTLVNVPSLTPLMFLVVNSNGDVTSSIDGINWTVKRSEITKNLSSFGYANGLFFAFYNSQVSVYKNGTWNGYTVPNNSYGWVGVTYGNGIFVAVSPSSPYVMTSPDGITWTAQTAPSGNWNPVAYGNGLFVAVATGSSPSVMTSPDGITWTTRTAPSGSWKAVTYANGLFVAVAAYSSPNVMTSPDGINWTTRTAPSGKWWSVTYGNGLFVAVATYSSPSVMTSPDGINWTARTAPYGLWRSLAYGNGLFVSTAYLLSYFMTSPDGINWTLGVFPNNSIGVIHFGIFASSFKFISDSVTVIYDPLQNKFVFSSVVYPSITFASAQDAAFWGFDYLQGPSFPFVNGVLTSQWTLSQGGWVQGFLPPALSAYDDAVAHKLVKEARVLVGRQVIKRYTGEYMELVNDLTIPYENKAILKLMNGTLDFTQAVASREYYVNIPLGCDSLPLCALTRQQMSIEIDFEEYRNLSNDLNKGTGDFFDPNSYLTYNVSQNLLGGQPFNVLSTLSYQQYILLLTTNGTFVVYDTTKPIDDPGSYQVITAFAGQTSVFVNFVVLGNILYIQLLTGYIVSGLLDELIQGNVSSFISNNYLPMSISDTGPPTGTMVCDARYLYYAQTNVASNVFFVRYDTRTPFQALGGYTSFNFTATIDPTVTSVYQILSTGNDLIALTNTPGIFYTFPIFGNFLTDWNVVLHGFGNITEGVVIGETVYFLVFSSYILKYLNGVFTFYILYNFFSAIGNGYYIISTDGINWINNPQIVIPLGNWTSLTYGNGLFVAVAPYSSPYVMTSPDGITWTARTSPPGSWTSVAYGNGLFVAVAPYTSPYVMTSPDGITWTTRTAPPGAWSSVAYGNGIFVAVTSLSYPSSPYVMTSPDGINWTTRTAPPGNWNIVTYGNGLFVAVSPYTTPSVMTSPDGITWTARTAPSGSWKAVTYGNGLFVAVAAYSSPNVMTSPDGINWTARTAPSERWTLVTYGNGLFVAVANFSSPNVMTSPDGINWTTQTAPSGIYRLITCNNKYGNPYIGPIKNLHAVGTTIYASANTSSTASIIQIDTTKDLATPAAYQYYTSGNSPISFAGNVPSIFANGPRYLYMFTNDPSQTTTPTNAIRYDPYPVNPTLQASIIADYKILPPGTPKPTWAEIKYIQTQHVTAESFADLQILGPVKELIVTGTPTAANVYQYSNLDGAVSLTITGNEEIITPDVGTVTGLGVMAPFQTHTVLPVRNLSVIPFEIDPESPEPNGTINFSRLQYQNLSNGASVWALSYNILKIESGIGGLKFNSPY